MSNDHYVPQHYLRGWAHDENEKKLYSYKLIEYTKKVVFGPASIVSSSSKDNLYTISDGENRAEFETSVMTSLVDTPGSQIIAKLRVEKLDNLIVPDLIKLASYISILEARHPDTIAKMTLSEQDVNEIFSGFENSHLGTEVATSDVKAFLLKIIASSGAAAAGMFAGWGHGAESKALLNRGWIEVDRNDRQGFICSNYPVGRYVEYEKESLFLTFPVSPNKALWLLPPKDYKQYINTTDSGRAATKTNISKYIDIATLGRATEAYSLVSDKDQFIEKHLGWAKRTPEGKWSAYIKMAMQDGNSVYPYS